MWSQVVSGKSLYFPFSFAVNMKLLQKIHIITKKLYHLFGPRVLQNNGILISTYKVLTNIESSLNTHIFLFFKLSEELLAESQPNHIHIATNWHQLSNLQKMTFQYNPFSEE